VVSLAPTAPEASRWPRSAVFTVLGLGVVVAFALIATGAFLLSRTAPLPPDGPESALPVAADEQSARSRATATPRPAERSTEAEGPSPEATGPKSEATAPNPETPKPEVDVTTPDASSQQAAQPQPSEAAPPAPNSVPLAAEACPTGEVIVTRPTSAELTLDPATAETLTNLGMSDRLDPDDQTTNHLAYSGGRIVNNTTSTVTLPNAPNVVPTGVKDGRALGGFDRSASDGSAELAPGASVGWTATGAGTFPLADVTGFALDLQWVNAWWVAVDDAPCLRPLLLER
jgi:hypothetical protein